MDIIKIIDLKKNKKILLSSLIIFIISISAFAYNYYSFYLGSSKIMMIGLNKSFFYAMIFYVITIFSFTAYMISHKKRCMAYCDWLSSIDIVILRLLSVSPELDRSSRRQVVSFLNRNYPGWSIDSAC